MLRCHLRKHNLCQRAKIKETTTVAWRLPWTLPCVVSTSTDIYKLQRYNRTMLDASQASKPVRELLWCSDAGWQTEPWLIWYKPHSSWTTDATSLCQSVFLTSKSAFPVLSDLQHRTYQWTANKSLQLMSYYGYTTRHTGKGCGRHAAAFLQPIYGACVDACRELGGCDDNRIYAAWQSGQTESDEQDECCSHTLSVHWWGDAQQKHSNTPPAGRPAALIELPPSRQTNPFWK